MAARTTNASVSKRGRLTQESILDEAATLFKQNGYRKTSLEDVATQLGVTRPAFYYWFRSKTDILVAIQRHAIAGLTNVAEEVDILDLSPRELFWRHIEAHIEYVASNAIEVGLVFEEESELPPEVAAEIQQQRRAYTARMFELYSADQDDVEEARLAVNAILGAATWTYRYYRPQLGKPSLVAKRIVKALRNAH